MNDNKNGTEPVVTPAEPTEDQKDAMLSAWSKEVANVLNHLRALYDKKMVLTFIARDPSDPTCFTRLSEEKDWEDFLSSVQAMGPPIPTPTVSDTVGNA